MQPDASAIARPLSYRELLLTLQRLCKEKRTGSMFINDGSEHSAKLMLEQGEIFDVSFKGQTGTAALALIKTIKQGKASFSSRFGQTNAERKINLSTPEILQLLAAAINTQTDTATATPPPKPQPAAASATPAPVANNTLHIEVPADYQAPENTQSLSFPP
jgi:hypothetical protein